MTPAVTPAVTPTVAIDLGDDGDLDLTEAGELVEATSPAHAQVALVLRTQRGSCPLDPTLGIDWARLDKAAPNAPAVLAGLIREGLAPLVADGTLRDLSVTAASPARGRLTFAVTYVDAVTAASPAHDGDL